MSKKLQMLDCALPVAEAADLTSRAAQCGMPLNQYLGFLVLRAAYGVSHPIVLATISLANMGHSAPQTAQLNEDDYLGRV